MDLNCEICDKLVKTKPSHFKKLKGGKITCSVKCSSILRKNKTVKNTECTQCKILFHLKESSKRRYKRVHGYFCSTKCVSDFRKIKYLGENNPNFRIQVDKDSDGYKLIYLPTFGRIKLHHKVVFEILNINKIPKNYHVHHRDCNRNNNDPINLVIINNSDHRWLHKQFGNATLWAYLNNKVSLDELIKWTNDIERAKRLLPISVLDQIGIFKQGELLENPTLERQKEDNQQPSLSSNTLEGSTTNSQIPPEVNSEDSNADTSALHSNKIE